MNGSASASANRRGPARPARHPRMNSPLAIRQLRGQISPPPTSGRTRTPSRSRYLRPPSRQPLLSPFFCRRPPLTGVGWRSNRTRVDSLFSWLGSVLLAWTNRSFLLFCEILMCLMGWMSPSRLFRICVLCRSTSACLYPIISVGWAEPQWAPRLTPPMILKPELFVVSSVASEFRPWTFQHFDMLVLCVELALVL